MTTSRERGRARFVSFSGVDGAGKTTQIQQLARYLEELGTSIRVLRFWDDVATLTKLREGAGHKVFKGEKGIGSPESPVNRRDKNVRGWPMTCLRLFLYLIDAFSLRHVVRKALHSDADFIIFDRYIYDELANIDLNRRFLRAYARFILRLIPRPDISFVLDTDAVKARARKPEYPLDFIRINRAAYLNLSQIIGHVTVIPPGEIEAAHREVLSKVLNVLHPNRTPESVPLDPAEQVSATDPHRTRPAVS